MDTTAGLNPRRDAVSCAAMDLPFHTPLSPDQQRAVGIATPQPYALADIVRFAELDILRHVNNTAYLRWFESLRVKSAMDMGLSAYGSPDTDPRIVIRRAETDWLSEIRADETYVTTARVESFRTSSFVEWQEIWVLRDGGATLAATLRAVMVTLAPDGQGRYALPDAVIAYMRAVHGAQDAR